MRNHYYTYHQSAHKKSDTKVYILLYFIYVSCWTGKKMIMVIETRAVIACSLWEGRLIAKAIKETLGIMQMFYKLIGTILKNCLTIYTKVYF